MQEAQVTVSVPELMQWMRDNGGAGTSAIAQKSAKGPDTMFFSAAGVRVAEDLELFRTSLSLKFDAESDRYPLPKNRVTYAFSRLEGKAATMCMVGLQEGRYSDWNDVIQELEGAFGELDPAFARDRRLLSLRQNGRSFVEHANEFRTLSQRTSFGEQALASVLRCSLSRELDARVSTEDLRGLGLGPLIELITRHDNALRFGSGSRPYRPFQQGAFAMPMNQYGPAPMDLDRGRDRPARGNNRGPARVNDDRGPARGRCDRGPARGYSERRNDRSNEYLCHRCHQYGHISKWCRTPLNQVQTNALSMRQQQQSWGFVEDAEEEKE